MTETMDTRVVPDEGEAQRQRDVLPRLALPGGALVLFIVSACYHFLIYAPQPDQPHLLTMLDDIFALGLVGVVALAGLALGRRVLRLFLLHQVLLKDCSRLVWNTLALGLGWGIGSLSILAIGLAHLLYSWTLGLLVALALAFCWRETWRIVTFPTWQRVSRAFRRCLPRGRVEIMLAALLVPELLLLGLQSLALPYIPYGSDAYLYHWAVPQLYLLHHAVIVWPGWAAADAPLNSELFSALALAFQSEIAAVWLQAVFGIAIALLLAEYLYQAGGRKAVWLGVTLCCANPLFTSLLFSSQPELAACYYGIASLLVVLAWLKHPNPRLLALAGLFAGFGLGAKYTEGQVIIGIGLLLLARPSLVAARPTEKHRNKGRAGTEAGGTSSSPRRRASWRSLQARARERPTERPVSRVRTPGVRKRPSPKGRSLAACAPLLFGAASLLALAPWLIRDWVTLQNPVYPFLWGGPGWNDARMTTWRLSTAHIGIQGALWQQMALGLFDLFFNTRRSGDEFYAPPGYLLLAALLAPIILLISRRSPGSAWQARRVLPWLLVAACGYIIWILLQAKVTYYAFLWLPLLLPPAVLALTYCWQSIRRWQSWHILQKMMQISLPVIFALVVLIQGPLYNLSSFVQRDPLPMLAGQQSLREWETHNLKDEYYWAMVRYINVQIPPPARLLVIGHGYFLAGYDYVDDAFLDWVPYLETQGKTPEGILRLLRQNRFDYLIYDEGLLNSIVEHQHNTYLGSFLPAFHQFLTQHLRQLGTFGAYQVYQIPGS